MRRLWQALLGLMALLLIAGLAGFIWVRSSLPKTDGKIAVAGLDAPVDVIRDAHGVPHIFANTAADAYFALGFVHAQDRLWQMEFTRRVGAGRLSEIFGPTTLATDRFLRTLGIYRLAEAQAAALPETLRRQFDAYAAGVNAFLENHRGASPPEFLVLGYAPEPWTVADSLVWGRLMALQLSSNWQTELLRANLSDRLTPQQLEELWPSDSPDAPVTLPTQASSLLPAELWRHLAEGVPRELRSDSASNAWVLDGSRTATGKPILANDPHLGFSAPDLWYLAHIVTPEFSTTGATVPGVPATILGHNGTIAWGMTTTGGDTQDVFVETLDPTDPARYLAPDGPRPFATRSEIIRIKDSDPVTIEVRETRHGPVISDLGGLAGALAGTKHVVVLATPALRPDDETPRALAAINRAESWSDFLDAARYFHSPQQNIFYADRHGDIGLIAPARIPLRKKGNGQIPVPGADGSYDWQGFVPFDGLPKIHNPPSGLIVNANNRLVDNTYPYAIAYDWEDPYRAARILDIIDERDELTMADNLALQNDIVSQAAVALLPLLLDTEPRDDRSRRALALLSGWNKEMSREQAAPLIYAAWLAEIMRALAADELGNVFPTFAHPRPRFIAAVLRKNRHWCDDVGTPAAENCADRLSLALKRALDSIAAVQGNDMGAWRWGKAHRAIFRHRVFTHVPLLNRIADLSIATDGGDHTVNRGQTGYQPDSGPFTHVHGAGYKAVYDLSDLGNSRFMIATGQSGNPLSPHYDDLLRPWRDSRYILVAGQQEQLRQASADVLTLIPRN